MEFPTLWLITRFPVGKYVGICLTMWGACLCFLALCHNFAGLATVRFILGILEAATLPSMMLINAMWYLREEQPLRTAFWHNTFAGVFGGILSYGIGKIGGTLSTWKVCGMSLRSQSQLTLSPVHLPHLWSFHLLVWHLVLLRNARLSLDRMVLQRRRKEARCCSPGAQPDWH
jgi:MFS family permease